MFLVAGAVFSIGNYLVQSLNSRGRAVLFSEVAAFRRYSFVTCTAPERELCVGLGYVCAIVFCVVWHSCVLWISWRVEHSCSVLHSMVEYQLWRGVVEGCCKEVLKERVREERGSVGWRERCGGYFRRAL